MDNQKHILLITPGFPRSEKDSWVTTYLSNYVRALKELTHYKITILSLHYPFEASTYLYEGYQVHALGGRNKSPIFKLRLLLKGQRIIKKIHGQKRIDAIHCLWVKDAALLGYRMHKILNSKVIITVMGTELNKMNIYNSLIDFSKIKLVVVSNRMVSIVTDRLKQVPTVIPWGIEKRDFDQNQHRNVDLLFVGFLNATKNLDLFLEIVLELKKEKQDCIVVVIGEEYIGQDYNKKILSFGLEKNINFRGRLENKDVLSLMERSKVLVHTSSFESQGYVFLEAMSRGMSIVSFDVGIAIASNKWHVAKSNDDFKSAILNLLSQEKKYIPKYPYLIEGTIESYSKLYEDDGHKK